MPKRLCLLSTESETAVDGGANHFDICNVRVGGPVYKEIATLVQKVLETAPDTIADLNRPCMTIYDSNEGPGQLLTSVQMRFQEY